MHTENKSITPSEKDCLLVSRCRQCPIERGNPLLKQVKNKTLNMHCIGLSWTDKGSKSSPTVRRRLENTNSMLITIESQQEELHRAQVKELHRRGQQLLHKQLLKQNWDLREAHEKSPKEMEELKKFQSSTFDTVARRRVVEDQDTILELIGKIQELQNEINCMYDSREFQDAESIRSGHSHVTSQPVSFPPHPIPGGIVSRSIGMPSRREGLPSIWDTHGISGNVFVNPTASSSAPCPQESNPWISNVSEHTSPHVMSESQTPNTALDPRCQ